MKVLFATDGETPAMDALSLLERVAAPGSVRITVATVGPDQESGNEKDQALDDVLGEATSRLKAAGFAADQRVLVGHPASTIVNEIANGQYELTVLGAGNRSRLGRILLGSVSTKVLHASPSSVLIVHQVSDLQPPTRVLLGTDGSRYADVAVDQMIRFLDSSSCEIDVVSVAEHLMPVISFPIPREAYATQAPTPELEKEWLEGAKAYATDAATKLESAGFKSNAQAQLGSPSLRLLDEMDEVSADLVVVGSRGLGALERAALGSVSDQIVRNAPATLVARD